MLYSYRAYIISRYIYMIFNPFLAPLFLSVSPIPSLYFS